MQLFELIEIHRDCTEPGLHERRCQSPPELLVTTESDSESSAGNHAFSPNHALSIFRTAFSTECLAAQVDLAQ
eukprot:3328006-Amphidinium_carterae.1